MAGEADPRSRIAALRPQVRDAAERQALATKSECCKPRSQNRLAARIVRRDRRSLDQLAGECQNGCGRRVHPAIVAETPERSEMHFQARPERPALLEVEMHL